MLIMRTSLSFALVGAVAASLACSDSGPAPAASRGEVAAEPPAEAPAAAPAAPMMEMTETAADTPADGDLPLPGDYTSWSSFVSGVQKPDTKQIRDIFLNDVAESVGAGSEFPAGSAFVMEIYTAKVDESGAPVMTEGAMEKGALSKIFVMEKNAGWGGVPATGEWVYAAYEPDGSKATVQYEACRACHLPLQASDFVFRVDEYLAARDAGE